MSDVIVVLAALAVAFVLLAVVWIVRDGRRAYQGRRRPDREHYVRLADLPIERRLPVSHRGTPEAVGVDG